MTFGLRLFALDWSWSAQSADTARVMASVKESPAFDTQKELRESQDASSKSSESTGAHGGKPDSLEDLFSTLKNQISSSDWLKENTAEKWVQENPELAKEYMDAAKKT
ncbi:uncharacterized protein LOC127847919 [Dreissena polymorpha]|uniref:Uncharacterized protein n=1 Tax=Dreissena polymorpha TaxID=45954 RepID=A0A9D4I3D1_DREPO|nr:uncharacterized protein LOC127847919 [Dreissena polymorpha]KAH3746665.1 hypothetical protein DPMN_181075 [Dreissena polymorpha]